MDKGWTMAERYDEDETGDRGPFEGPCAGGRFDAGGFFRRVRRQTDLNQRELAVRIGVSKSLIAAVEAGRRDPSVAVLLECLAIAGLRLAVLDRRGDEVPAMSPDAARNRGERHFPAHLDVLLPEDERWPRHWGAGPRHDRARPQVVVSRRERRDERRAQSGIPSDHPSGGQVAAAGAELDLARRRRAAADARARVARQARPEPPACTCSDDCESIGRACPPDCP